MTMIKIIVTIIMVNIKTMRIVFEFENMMHLFSISLNKKKLGNFPLKKIHKKLK